MSTTPGPTFAATDCGLRLDVLVLPPVLLFGDGMLSDCPAAERFLACRPSTALAPSAAASSATSR